MRSWPPGQDIRQLCRREVIGFHCWTLNGWMDGLSHNQFVTAAAAAATVPVINHRCRWLGQSLYYKCHEPLNALSRHKPHICALTSDPPMTVESTSFFSRDPASRCRRDGGLNSIALTLHSQIIFHFITVPFSQSCFISKSQYTDL